MASAGLRCCCTPPPNAKELGACCYTEEIFGILYPRCIPSLTEEQCAGSEYPNAAFSAGLPCGNRVDCAIDIFDVDGPKAIKKVFTPKSRYNSYLRDIQYFSPGIQFDNPSFRNLFNNNKFDYRHKIKLNYGTDTTDGKGIYPDHLGNGGYDNNINTVFESYPRHDPVNYFYFVTNDNTLYLCITLDNIHQQKLTQRSGYLGGLLAAEYINHQTRIFPIQDDFSLEDKENITASDNFEDIPMLFWTEKSNGQISSSLGSIYYSYGPFWSAGAKEFEYIDGFSLERFLAYDYYDNIEFLYHHLTGTRFSKLSSKYGGRITAITTDGRIVQGGSYQAGAAVSYKPDDGTGLVTDSQFETTGLKFIPRKRDVSSGRPAIDIEDDQAAARERLESYDDNTKLDQKGIYGSIYEQQVIGRLNLRKIKFYNSDRADLRRSTMNSIRGAIKIEENFYATAVLTEGGSISTWGNPKYGGDDYFNSVQRIRSGTSGYSYTNFLILNSKNQETESSVDYVELLPMGRGFLGFKTWDGSNNNVTLFGFFDMNQNSDEAFADYENFISNGKRYEPSDAVLLNDGGVILKAFGEDNYTIVGGQNGHLAIQGSFSAPSAGLTIKKALCAWQIQRRETSCYLVLWSNGTLQTISFDPTYLPNRADDPSRGLSTNTFQYGWAKWFDEEVPENRTRTFTGVRDIFLVNQSYGFGYILENDDADGYNTILILKRGSRYNRSEDRREFYNESVPDTGDSSFGSSTPPLKMFLDGFNMDYEAARNSGADIQDIITNIYKAGSVDTGFTRVRYKKIDYATSSCADPYSGYGPDIDNLQDDNYPATYWQELNQRFSAAFLYTKQNFDTDIADGENNIIGVYFRCPKYGNGGLDRNSRVLTYLTKSTFVKHTRRNPVDSKTEDAGTPLFNFDYINLFVNQKGQLLNAPGIQYKNDSYWSNAELFLTGEVGGTDVDFEDLPLSINNTQTIETFENCSDSICIICGGTSHKCNVETGECFDCVPAGSQGYHLPSCDEVPDIFPWSLTINGSCESNPCPPEFTVGCCCAYYQRTPEEPVWFLQQVVTIPRNELTGIDQYIQQNGCFENSSFQYYDGSPIPFDEIEYTFTPFDDNFTELNCGAELFSNDFVQTCGEDLFDGSNTFVSVDNIDLREPCDDVAGNRTVDITFTKRVQGLRCKVDYNIPSINLLLQDIGCGSISNDSGTITFLEDENEKIITLNICCKLTGTFNVSYTVSPV